MTLSLRKLIGFVILIPLVACSTTVSTPIAPQPSQPIPEVNESLKQPLTITAFPTVTRFPTSTPNQTQTSIAQAFVSTRTAEEKLMSQYPRICNTVHPLLKYSPNELWMEESCYSDVDQGVILTISNKDTQVIWKLTYKDYVQPLASSPNGGLAVIRWTSNGQYAYFASLTGGEGGECFVGWLDSGRGLFRLDLQTGNTSAILPLFDDFGWYGFSFSPTDRRLVYGARSRDLQILDITTGQLINIASVNGFEQSGGYTWSPDGLKLAYSTVLDINNGENFKYTLQLADAQTGSDQILLESSENCFNVRSWSDSNILTIESLVEYDLNSNKIISGATSTP
jgi:hypothetical protein